MRKRRYDEYAAHKAEHEALLDEIRDIMDDYEAGSFSDAGTALATTVQDWFVNHFKTKDARLHKQLGVERERSMSVQALRREAEPAFAEPHPFAAYLRTIGRGPTLSPPARHGRGRAGDGQILDGTVEPVQLGGFLLVLRYRTETPAELAGFVRAARARIARADARASISTGRPMPTATSSCPTSCWRPCCSPVPACGC